MNEQNLPTFEEHLYSCEEIQKNAVFLLRCTETHLAKYEKLKAESNINDEENNEMVEFLTAVELYLTEDIEQNNYYIQSMLLEKNEVIKEHIEQVESLESKYDGEELESEKIKLKLQIASEDLIDSISGSYVTSVKTNVTVLNGVAVISQGWGKLELTLTDSETNLSDEFIIEPNSDEETEFRNLVDKFKCIHFKNWLSNRMRSFVLDKKTGKYCVDMKHKMKESGEVSHFILSI